MATSAPAKHPPDEVNCTTAFIITLNIAVKHIILRERRKRFRKNLWKKSLGLEKQGKIL
jgi:hypothetical protein